MLHILQYTIYQAAALRVVPFLGRRELLESVEKNFRLVLRLLTGKFFWKPKVETCSCLCGARACGGGACAMQCWDGGAVRV